MRIFLDLDGVLADLVSPFMLRFGMDLPNVLANWPRGSHELAKVIGRQDAEVWNEVASWGSDFWANLPEYPWARELYETCAATADTYFLTAPTHSPQCLAGKLEWMHRFTGSGDFRNYLIAFPKFCCAKYGHVLIDDRGSNCRAFEENGGRSILFPRPWNELHASSDNALQSTLASLAKIAEEIKPTGAATS